MIKRIIRSVVLALFVFNMSISSISAARTREYYMLDIDSLDSSVKPYISSVVVEKDDLSVYINNTYVGTMSSDPQTFSLSNWNPAISVKVYLSQMRIEAHVSETVAIKKNYRAGFKFELAENTYYVCTFYPDINGSSESETQQSTRSGDIHSFSFGHSYDGNYVSFNVQLSESSGKVYVNGKEFVTIDKQSVPVVFEYIGEDFPITTINYQDTLPSFNWSTASLTNHIFYNSDFSNISVKQDYALSNEYLNLPTQNLTFGSWVNEYQRVGGSSQTGTGVWQATGNKIKVVCEYYEDNTCANRIRTEFPRYWAVLSSRANLQTYPITKVVQTVSVVTPLYKNYYYNSWTETYAFPSSTAEGVIKQYSQKTISWTDGGYNVNGVLEGNNGWVRAYYTECIEESASTASCRYTASKKLYRKATRAYTDSDWITFCSYCGTQIDSRTRWAQKTRSYSDSGWIDYCSYCGTQIDQRTVYKQRTRSCSTTDWIDYCSYCGTQTNSRTVYRKRSCSSYNVNYSNYGAYKTSKYGYTSYCNSRTGRNSECGTENKSCTRTYSCKTRTCKKSQIICTAGYTYSNCAYKYDGSYYGSYNRASGSYIGSQCGTQNKSCTSYSCAQTQNKVSCKSWGSWSGYDYTSCASNIDTDCGSKTQYKYYSCGSWGDWTGYNYTSCSASDTKECSSKVQYNYRSYSDWGSWSGYDYTSCSESETKECSSQLQYRYRSYSDWGSWSAYEHETCSESETVKCDLDTVESYKYSYRQESNWGSWITTTSGKVNTDVFNYKYRYSFPTIKWEEEKATGSYANPEGGVHAGEVDETNHRMKDMEIATPSLVSKKYTTIDQPYTYEEVLEFQNAYAADAAGQTYYYSALNKKASDEKYVLWSEYQAGVRTSDGYSKALADIRDEEIYQPFLYFYGWRFITSNQMLPISTSAEVKPIETTITETTNYDSGGILILSSEPLERDTKVIYYDYRDPLSRYKDNLPENWEGYEWLISAIENSDLNNKKITVKISSQDLKDMKEWVYANGSDPDDCSMLMEFIHIFDTATQSRISSGACKASE